MRGAILGAHVLSYKMAMGGTHCENAGGQVVQTDSGVARRGVVRHAKFGGGEATETLAHALVPLGGRFARILAVLEGRSPEQGQVEAAHIIIYRTPSATRSRSIRRFQEGGSIIVVCFEKVA